MVNVVSRVFPAESCVVAEVMPSPSHGERKDNRRPDMILLHYTGMADPKAALELLRKPGSEVSAHYFVFEDGRIIQLVQELRRAWHAGVAFWAGETDINSCSIGIEIANPGHDYGYPDFPRRQIAAVTALCRSIQTRYTIPPVRVLAHSDVAPARKQDPGEKFPWRTLHDSGVGHWVKPRRSRKAACCLRSAIAARKSLRCRPRSPNTATASRSTAITIPPCTMLWRRSSATSAPSASTASPMSSTRTTLHELLAHRGRVRTIAARARETERIAS